MIETERLLLREYTMDDFDALYEIMSDPETMQHYPAPFDTLSPTGKLMIQKNMSFEEVVKRVATQGGITEVGSRVISY